LIFKLSLPTDVFISSGFNIRALAVGDERAEISFIFKAILFRPSVDRIEEKNLLPLSNLN